MSKSKGNHIGVNDGPNEQFGKAMSIPDDVVMDFFVLATNVPRTELPGIHDAIGRDPMQAKKQLARTIVSEFWGDDAAAAAQAEFERTVQRKEAPAEMPEFAVGEAATMLDVLVAAGVAPSKREVRRLFEQHAVTVDGRAVEPGDAARAGQVIQVGKRRWLRLV